MSEIQKNIESMTPDEMDDEIHNLNDTIAMIKLQISNANIENAIKKGTHCYGWLKRAKFALAKKSAFRHKLILEAAKVRKQIMIDRELTLDTCFVDIARVTIDGATFKKIMIDAKALQANRLSKEE